ncbi:HAUS6 protein, partial [Hydrobates tethys]|nr:HAUS6 protein [Oceanodroma tethys]
NMFDNPDSMFHVIALFLFGKLGECHTAETFGDCSIPGGEFTDPEFRKQCFVWLKDIANEDESCLPQVAPSSFISPAGPRFIQLLYWFARHVVVKDMKTSSVGTDIPFAEDVMLTPTDMYMVNARCRVAYNKLLHIFQKEDFVIQEYEKKTQLLIKEINQMKSEFAVLQIQSCKMKQNDQNKNDKTERIPKVRSMWTLIMETLTSLKKEKEVVDSVLDVLENRVVQCILDGTKVVFSVPWVMAHRIESGIHQVCTGNVYEAEKLNFLTVIQLLNEALRTLKDEPCQSELKQQIQVIEDKIMHHNKVLQDLDAKRLKREQQHCVSMSGSVPRKEEDWGVKWESFLGLRPFNLILDQYPVKEEEDEDSIFCQHLGSVSDVCDSIHEVLYEKDDGALETMMDESTPPRRRISSVPLELELSKASEDREVLIEKDLHIETCKGKEKPVSPKILENGKDESTISKMWESAGDHFIQRESPIKKEDSLKKARDELAEEVAKTVISESPHSDEGKGTALEDLTSSLVFNPFLTRKQIPRTPENLLTEIRSSWREAIEAEGSSDIKLAPTEVIIEEAPMDAGPIMEKASASRFVCSNPASPIPDFDPPLSERDSQLSPTEFRPQEQLRVSRIIGSPISETSGMRESERTEEQELKCIVLNKSSVEDPEEQTFQYVKKSMNIPDTRSENNSRTNVLLSDRFRGSLADRVLHWNISPLSSSIRREAAFLGILDETFPEELDNIDPNKSESSESDFGVIDSAYVTGDSKNKGDIQKSKLNLESLLNTHKALKKITSRSEEEVHQTHYGGESVSCRSDLSLAPKEGERDEFCSPLELFCLDEEFTKMTSPTSSGNEGRYSLSSLLVSSQRLEEMASMVHEIPLDLIHKLKDKEQLNEKPVTKEPSS